MRGWVDRLCATTAAVVALVALGVRTVDGSLAQEVVIADDPSPPCDIDFAPGQVFGAGGLDEKDWLSGLFGGIEPLADGRLLFSDLPSTRFLEVSPDGSRRWIGRGGEGPGEYRWIQAIRAQGDMSPYGP